MQNTTKKAAADRMPAAAAQGAKLSPAFLAMVCGMAVSIICFFLAPNVFAEGIAVFGVNVFGALAIAVKIAKL